MAINISFAISTIIFFIPIFVISILCLIVFFKDKRNPININFSLLSLGIIGWLVTLTLYSNYFKESSTLTFIGRLNFAFVILLAYFSFRFALVFPQSFLISKTKEYFLGLETFILLLITLFTSLIDNKEIYLHGIEKTNFGLLYPLFIFHFLFYLVLTLTILLVKKKRLKGNASLQLNYVILGISLASIFGTTTSIILPYLFSIFSLQNLGGISILILISFLTLAIIKHRFLGINTIIGKIIYWIILVSIPYLSFYTTYFFESNIFNNLLSERALEINIVLAFIYLVIYNTVKDNSQKFLNQLFFNIYYDASKITELMFKESSQVLDIDILSNTIQQILNISIKPQKIILIIGNIEENRYKAYNMFNLKNPNDIFLLYNSLTKSHKGLFTYEDIDELKYLEITKKNNILKLFSEEEISIVISGENYTILLGNKNNEIAYLVEDLSLLKRLMDIISLSINRALLYKETQEFADELEEKVREATEELKAKNQYLNDAYSKLQQLDKEKDDLLSISSHELRTPATIVKNALLIAKGYNTIQDEKTLSKINMSIEANDRLISLINTMLEVTRINANRMEYNLTLESMPEIINQAVVDLQSFTHEKNVSLTFIPPKEDIPKIMVDRTKIREVLDNLITNAIKYNIQNGKVWVNIKKDDSNIIISIRDTGIGIAEKDIPELFQMFKRLNNTPNNLVRPGGTGLGLFVVKNIIEKHKGKIWVDSKEGEGSTFFFKIPLYIKEREFIEER